MSRAVVLKLEFGDRVKVVSDCNNPRVHSQSYSGFTVTFLFWIDIIIGVLKINKYHSSPSFVYISSNKLLYFVNGWLILYI